MNERNTTTNLNETKKAEVNMNTMNTPETATPVTIMMERDAFFRWLAEAQGVADPGTTPCNEPDFLIEDVAGPDSPWFEVAAYLNTADGTVIARHLRNSDRVMVTIRDRKPGPNLLRTVREMIDETRTDLEGEAA